MIVLSSAIRLALSTAPAAHRPLLGYHNLVTYSNLVATSGDDDYPVTNLANPNTTLTWRSLILGVQYITITVNSDIEVDYLAIGRHNFGSGGIISSVERLSADEDAVWTEVVEETTVADDSPHLYWFEGAPPAAIRIKMQPDETLPEIGVLYLGKLLVMEKGIQPGHTPAPYARRREYVVNHSTAGEFLGKIQTGESLRTSASFRNLTAAWWRLNLDPFLADPVPFFFAHNPRDYPDEVAFCELSGDATPVPAHANGMTDITLEFDAIAL